MLVNGTYSLVGHYAKNKFLSRATAIVVIGPRQIGKPTLEPIAIAIAIETETETYCSERGHILEEVINDKQLTVLNTGQPIRIIFYKFQNLVSHRPIHCDKRIGSKLSTLCY